MKESCSILELTTERTAGRLRVVPLFFDGARMRRGEDERGRKKTERMGTGIGEDGHGTRRRMGEDFEEDGRGRRGGRTEAFEQEEIGTLRRTKQGL